MLHLRSIRKAGNYAESMRRKGETRSAKLRHLLWKRTTSEEMKNAFGSTQGSTTFTEFSYTQPGQVAGKGLRVTKVQPYLNGHCCLATM
jgi:hypothetical protein